MRENPALLRAGMNLSFLETDKKILRLLSRRDSFMDFERQETATNTDVGMMLSHLDIKTFYDIADIYGQVVGGHPQVIRTYDPQEVMEYINNGVGNFKEWRFGSSLVEDKTQDGKLGLWIVPQNFNFKDKLIRFGFDPNAVEGEQADKLKEEFKKTVAKYLIDHKLAVELPK